MKKGDLLYIRNDEKIQDTLVREIDYKDHIDYLTKVSEERFFVGGGYLNNPGGMIIFAAKDIEDAKDMCDRDPLIERNLYRYTLMIWEVVIKSNE